MEWISVEDRLPEVGKSVAVWDTVHGYIPFVVFDGNSWVSQFIQWSGKHDYWMPLPEPPKK